MIPIDCLKVGKKTRKPKNPKRKNLKRRNPKRRNPKKKRTKTILMLNQFWKSVAAVIAYALILSPKDIPAASVCQLNAVLSLSVLSLFWLLLFSSFGISSAS